MRRITLAESGGGFDCPAFETILRSGLRAGVGLPYSCTVGSCGECKIEVLAGEMEPYEGEPPPGLSARDLSRGRALACQARPRTDCTIKAPVERQLAPAHRPEYRLGRLEAVEWIGPEMLAFRLVTAEPALFLPGQFARLLVPSARAWRAYSMANLANHEGVWEFILRPMAGGIASEFFQHAEPGDPITFDAPFGHAVYASGSDGVTCVAGGAGLAPTLSVARAAARDPQCRSIRFFYGGRDPDDLCAGPLLQELERPGLTLSVTEAISSGAPAHPNWKGRRGMIHEHLEAAFAGASAGERFFVAGPPPMVEATLSTINAAGFDPAQVRYDRFF